MLRVVVVDDEPLARERVGDLVRTTPGLELVATGGDGLQALDLIARHAPDLLFIDVEMPELSGFGVVAALDGAQLPGVVFVTAFEHYAVRAFDVGAIDYLHKPITRQRFAAAAARAVERLSRRSPADERALLTGAARAERALGTRTRFVVRHRRAHHFVPVDQVDWIDAADNYLRLHVGTRVHLARGTMKDAESELDASRFVRIHRSVIVAIDRIATIRSLDPGGYVVTLTTGARLRGSRQYGERLRSLVR